MTEDFEDPSSFFHGLKEGELISFEWGENGHGIRRGDKVTAKKLLIELTAGNDGAVFNADHLADLLNDVLDLLDLELRLEGVFDDEGNPSEKVLDHLNGVRECTIEDVRPVKLLHYRVHRAEE